MAEFLIEDDILKKVWDIQEDEVIQIPYGVKVIGEKVFYGERIRKVEIPDSVICMESRAFSHCKNLEEIEIPDSVTEIGAFAFAACNDLRKVKLSHSLKVILACTFAWCKNLEEIEIPDSVERIEIQAFQYCRSITVLKIPDSVKYLGEGAFFRCKELKSVVFSKSVAVIPHSCFGDCFELKEIIIPENVERVEYAAFAECKTLEKIIISDDLKKIPPVAFVRIDTFKVEIQIDGEPKYIVPVYFSQISHEYNYDSYFERLHKKVKIEAALLRLKVNYQLTEEYRKKYLEYLEQHFKETVEYCIDVNSEYIAICEEIGLFQNQENIFKAIDYAKQIQNIDMAAFLMNYYHEHFDKSENFLNLEEL